MIKLIALDLDGTIVNDQLKISPDTMAMLSRVREERGVRVVIATGRMFPSTLPFAQALGLKDPVISYQGAMVRDVALPQADFRAHPVLYHQPIPLETAREIIDVIQAEGYHANVYIDDCLFTTDDNPNSLYYQTISGVVPQATPDLAGILTAPPTKIMIIDPRADAIIVSLRERFGDRISACMSRADFCEIVEAGVSKWRGIESLLSRWDILPEEVMAVGDQENDLSMIQNAGFGVAMGNASDLVKASADFITKPISEDGVVHAIKTLIYEADALPTAVLER